MNPPAPPALPFGGPLHAKSGDPWARGNPHLLCGDSSKAGSTRSDASWMGHGPANSANRSNNLHCKPLYLQGLR